MCNSYESAVLFDLRGSFSDLMHEVKDMNTHEKLFCLGSCEISGRMKSNSSEETRSTTDPAEMRKWSEIPV